ncbi:hypothetical protein B0O99DRAFT_529260 [Bisporella sp. PMI_857]|nr:hypothetical protein B0O99DRAFT_529260 [Bisporella sp. PMI_857]
MHQRQEKLINNGLGLDNYVQSQVAHGVMDNYSPSPTPFGTDNSRPATYDPPTPHSFHGSQSSAINEQESAFHSQHIHTSIPKERNGIVEDGRTYPYQPRHHPANNTNIPPPSRFSYPIQGPADIDHYDGLVFYLQSQFSNCEFADWELELRYSDDRARPLRVPGHNLILARSPKLKALMRAQNPQIQRNDGKSLLIESNDRFLRSDGFWMAMQRLYGGPLLTPNVGMPHVPKNIHPLAASLGTPAERFDEALGYAVAGHILEVPPVLKRGVEVASMLLNWDTIEKALDFALDGGLGPNWRALGQVDGSPTYGPIVDIILHSALDFVCTHFPADFQLDISAPDPQHNRRLPAMPQDRPPAQNPRLSLLKFGDHPGDHEGGKVGLNSSTSSILSRIFLNLPFQLLKHILENDHLGSFEGWANQKSIIREKAMDSIVQERERRRVKALAYVQYHAEISDQLYDSLHMRESVILRDGSSLLVRHLEAS